MYFILWCLFDLLRMVVVFEGLFFSESCRPSRPYVELGSVFVSSFVPMLNLSYFRKAKKSYKFIFFKQKK